MTREKLAAVGLFVLVTLGLFATALFLIGERRLLFTRQIELATEFARLNNLQVGAPVRVSGMAAGEVREIAVPERPGGRFRVRFTVRDDLEALVRTDSIASIQTEGLVGGTYLAVAAGTEQAPAAGPGAVIPSREPMDIADILEQLSGTVALVTETITDLRADIEVAIRAVTDTALRADAVVAEIGEDITAIAASGRRITDDTAAIVADVRAGRGTVGRLLNEDEAYRRAMDIMAEAQRIVAEVQATVAEVQATVAETRNAIATLNQEGGPTQTLAADLRQTVVHARSALANLEENTEALKRNWFFRGFFRNRGYYSLDDLSPSQYREGVLKRGGREDLRIWLRGELIFEPGPDAVLSDEGRIRLDSAMATFLRYPLDGPLIVEGHVAGAPAGEAFVTARARASAVREYLIDRFELNPRTVGIVPLTGAGDRGPDGQPWDGVALAFFVERSALREAHSVREARPGAAPDDDSSGSRDASVEP